MKGLSNIDYIYTIAGILFGLVMISSPRIFLRKVKIDGESIKTEELLKKVGIGLIVLSIIFAMVIFFT